MAGIGAAQTCAAVVARHRSRRCAHAGRAHSSLQLTFGVGLAPSLQIVDVVMHQLAVAPICRSVTAPAQSLEETRLNLEISRCLIGVEEGGAAPGTLRPFDVIGDVHR
ncbi:hypothetical protein BES08_11990 [Novosphingobium resinovorum]|uniref:Uncharacterized protein n=1 Tax=Novosphingobium resinovorum TaxID=158500 RepID=A0A1D8A5M4_9SPHN|nr:hypothetical protein BES08_11990 [Novosphingobium resinovorum]